MLFITGLLSLCLLRFNINQYVSVGGDVFAFCACVTACLCAQRMEKRQSQHLSPDAGQFLRMLGRLHDVSTKIAETRAFTVCMTGNVRAYVHALVCTYMFLICHHFIIFGCRKATVSINHSLAE